MIVSINAISKTNVESKGKDFTAIGFYPEISFKKHSGNDNYPSIILKFNELFDNEIKRNAHIVIDDEAVLSIFRQMPKWDLSHLPNDLALQLAKKFLDTVLSKASENK